MTTRKVRNHIVGGCLATMLLPAGMVFAQSRIEPEVDPCSVQREQARSTVWEPQLPLLAPVLLTSNHAIQFWSPTPLVPLVEICLAEPTGGASAKQPTSAQPAKKQTAHPEDAPPATVQNLRRADSK